MPIATTNPATGKVVKIFEAHSDAQVNSALARAQSGYEAMRALPMKERARLLHRAADLLDERADALADIITLEMGKPLAQARGEVTKCALGCRHYADHAADYLADEFVQTDAARSYRRFLPLGVVLAVMPWNYPLWQVFRFAAPALMAGNAGLLKHASNVPQCALAIQDVFEDAGFPDGAFQTLLIGGRDVERVLRDERIRAATLTGSELAGAAVASVCGELIKPTVLELGGSDAFIVLPSADMDRAVEVGLKARFQNNGQSCIAAKRFIVHADVYDTFRDRFVAAVETMTVGDPTDPATDIGPLVDAKACEAIVEQVENAVAAGATLATGGTRLGGPDHPGGAFMRPGVLEDIPESADVYRDEVFGPVALFFRARDLDHALAIANDSPFGLGGSVFTQNKAEIARVVDGLEAGATFVNSMTASDPRLPFGGIKRSGYGRELAYEGIRAFCNIKTVSVA